MVRMAELAWFLCELDNSVLLFVKKLFPFQNHRDSLPHADTHGTECVFALRALQLVNRRGYNARSAGTERMSNGDRSAVWIHVLGIVGKP